MTTTSVRMQLPYLPSDSKAPFLIPGDRNLSFVPRKLFFPKCPANHTYVTSDTDFCHLLESIWDSSMCSNGFFLCVPLYHNYLFCCWSFVSLPFFCLWIKLLQTFLYFFCVWTYRLISFWHTGMELLNYNLSVSSTLFSSVQSLSCVQLFATPWIAACQASLSIPNSRSLFKLMPIESVMPSSHLILCRQLYEQLQNNFQNSLYHFTLSLTVYKSSSFSMPSPTLGVTSLLKFCYSGGNFLISHCDLALFPWWWMMLNIFRVLTNHSYIFNDYLKNFFFFFFGCATRSVQF